MSKEQRIASTEDGKHKGLRRAAKIIGGGAAAGFIGVAGITIEHHRNLTHRSLEPHPVVSALIKAEQSSLGVGDPTIWASVHRIHHEMTDASLFPFFQMAGAIEWAQRPENVGTVEVPEAFPHLDPFVPEFSLDEVVTIGNLAKDHIKEKLGDVYQEKTDYTADEVREILNPHSPRYVYPDYKHHKGEWTTEDMAQILLTDPHSPVLTGGENGVKRIALKNIGLYQRAAALFTDHPERKPDDLQHPDGKNTSTHARDVIAGFAIPAAAVLFTRRKFDRKSVAEAVITGAAINAARVGLELVGGNVTNSMGHAGVFDQNRLVQAALRTKYDIHLNEEDGSVTTDTVHSGLPGKLLSWLTLDEVGGQKEHHAHPEEIAYTSQTGKDAVKEAPWGSLLEFLAKNKHFPLLQEGKGFEGTRPDVPHEGVLLIQQARVRNLKKDQAAQV